MERLGFLCALGLLLLNGCAHRSQASAGGYAGAKPKSTPQVWRTDAPQTTQLVVPRAPRTAVPQEGIVERPSPEPALAASLPPTRAPSIAPTALPRLEPKAIRIISMSADPTTVSSGTLVNMAVQTSSNVASVEVRIGGQSTSLPKVAPGRFFEAYRVPQLPIFIRGVYVAQVIARTTRGRRATATYAITVR